MLIGRPSKASLRRSGRRQHPPRGLQTDRRVAALISSEAAAAVVHLRRYKHGARALLGATINQKGWFQCTMTAAPEGCTTSPQK